MKASVFVTNFTINVAGSLQGMLTKVFVRACNIFEQCSPSTSTWIDSLINLHNDIVRSSLTFHERNSTGALSVEYKALDPTDSTSVPLNEFRREVEYDVAARNGTSETFSSFIGCFNYSFSSLYKYASWDQINEKSPSTVSCSIACKAEGFEFMALNAGGCMCGSVFEVNIFNATQVSDTKCNPVCLFEKTFTPKRFCGNDGNTAVYRVNLFNVATSPYFNSIGQARYGVATTNNYKILCQNGGFVIYSQSRITVRFNQYSGSKCNSGISNKLNYFSLCAQTDHFFCAKYDELHGWVYQAPVDVYPFTPHASDVIIAVVDYPMDGDGKTFQEPRMTIGQFLQVGEPPIQLGYHDGDIQIKWNRNNLDSILDTNYEDCQVVA